MICIVGSKNTFFPWIKELKTRIYSPIYWIINCTIKRYTDSGIYYSEGICVISKR
jgi:hypothetical protein